MANIREAELTILIHTIKDVKDLEQLKVFLQELILRLTRILKDLNKAIDDIAIDDIAIDDIA